MKVLGNVVRGEIKLSDAGRIVDECWRQLSQHFRNVTLDEYQIMPDHFHGIVVIWDPRRDLGRSDSSRCDLSRCDLINQITTKGDSTKEDQITTKEDPTEEDQTPKEEIDLPVGIDDSQFGPQPSDWILMKNPKQTLGKVIRHFKARATKLIHDGGFEDFQWQRGYYERIIRDEGELECIREYIRNNLMNWNAS